MKRGNLTQVRLKELLDYDPETGLFRWRIKRSQKNVGSIAGCINVAGYRQISLDNVLYRGARLAWLYVYGCWPTNEVDHINCDRADDKFSNLRDVTGSQNKKNVPRKSNNKTGFKGVCRHSQATDKFMAQITVNWKPIYLGLFDSPEKAYAAYCKASERLHGKFGRIK